MKILQGWGNPQPGQGIFGIPEISARIAELPANWGIAESTLFILQIASDPLCYETSRKSFAAKTYFGIKLMRAAQAVAVRCVAANLEISANGARTLDLIHFGVNKDPLGSRPQFVDEYLCDLAKPSAPEDSDWQAWKST